MARPSVATQGSGWLSCLDRFESPSDRFEQPNDWRHRRRYPPDRWRIESVQLYLHWHAGSTRYFKQPNFVVARIVNGQRTKITGSHVLRRPWVFSRPGHSAAVRSVIGRGERHLYGLRRSSLIPVIATSDGDGNGRMDFCRHPHIRATFENITDGCPPCSIWRLLNKSVPIHSRPRGRVPVSRCSPTQFAASDVTARNLRCIQR